MPAVMRNVYKCHSEFFTNGEHSPDLGIDEDIIFNMVIKNMTKG